MAKPSPSVSKLVSTAYWVGLSVAYWFAALFLLGGVIVIYGDCPTDPRANGVALCFAEQRHIIAVGFAVATFVYAIAMYLAWRRVRR